MNKQDIIISLLKEIDKNIDNVGSGGTNANLKELTITTNGEYLPADYDADGFSKVTAEFDISSLPKVKIYILGVPNECINEEGRWEGDVLIDTSECKTMENAFYGNTEVTHLDTSNWNTSKVTNMRNIFNSCYKLQNIDVSNWDTRNVTNMSSLFHDCTSLKFLDVSKWDVSQVTNMSNMFRSLHSLDLLDLTKWDVSKVTNVNYMFYNQSGKGQLTSIIGGRTIEDVIINNISCLNGLKISTYMFTSAYNLDRASLRALINGLADLTGQPAGILDLGGFISKLTEEDIAIATAKNWTIA